MVDRLVRLAVPLLMVACTATAPGSPFPTGSLALPSATINSPTPEVTPTPPTPPTPPGPRPSALSTAAPIATSTLPLTSPVDAARADLDNLLVQLELIHPEPFHGIAREQWVAELDQLKVALPDLTPFQAQVELSRIVGLLSREGRDGHQFALPINEGPALPFSTYEFEEGVFVTAALTPHADLIGQQLIAVNGHPIADVLATLEPLIPRDGPATVPAFRQVFFPRTSVLRGLGIVDEFPVPVTVRDDSGAETEVAVDPVSFGEYAALVGQNGVGLPPNGTLYLSAPSPTLWWQDLPETNTFYIHYAQVAYISPDDIDAIRSGAFAAGVERVVLDLRQNPGGDNHLYVPLLWLVSEDEINVQRQLFVLTDRRTFSAASNFATELEQSTDATFVGEPMGGGLNFWNDVRQVRLNNYPVPMSVGVSTRYWQKSTADDPRLTIDPEIAFAITAADYFGGRDPVMEAVTTR